MNRARSGGRPGLVVAVAPRPLGVAQHAAPRPVGPGRPGRVRLVGRLIGARHVGDLGRRPLQGVVQPAEPAGRHLAGLDLAVEDDPAPLREWRLGVALAVIAVAEFVLADEFAVVPGPDARPERLGMPPGKELKQEFLHETPRRTLSANGTDYAAPGRPCPSPRNEGVAGRV